VNPLIRKSLSRLQLLGETLAIAILLLWLGDWVVFRVRASHGSAFQTIQVKEYLTTPLKGSKEEYDFLGNEMESCARALFPHAGAPPCWWLRRHTTQWE
jgi:hypothetical protein